LHGSIKKAQLQKILDSLSDSGDLLCKEYNSKIYLASQKYFPPVDVNVMLQLDQQIDDTKITLTELKETSASLTADLKNIQLKYTDEELANQILQRGNNADDLHSELKKWEDGQIEKIQEEKIIEAEKNYNSNKASYKKAKKICLDILDMFCENMEMKTPDFMVKFI
jgi:hypothetical protein